MLSIIVLPSLLMSRRVVGRSHTRCLQIGPVRQSSSGQIGPLRQSSSGLLSFLSQPARTIDAAGSKIYDPIGPATPQPEERHTLWQCMLHSGEYRRYVDEHPQMESFLTHSELALKSLIKLNLTRSIDVSRAAGN